MSDTLTVKTDPVPDTSRSTRPSYRVPLLLGRTLSALWPLADALVIVGLAVLSGLAYHWAIYGQSGPVLSYFHLGLGVAGLRLVLRQAKSYDPSKPKGTLRYEFYLWNATFLGIIVIAFFMKVSADYSRGAVVLYYVVGLPVLVTWQSFWRRSIREGYSSGALAVHRALLVGTPDRIAEFRDHHRPADLGLIVSGVVNWPEHVLADTALGRAALEDAIGHTIKRVRQSDVEEVVILVPWSYVNAINTIAEMFKTAPVRVRLVPETIMDRFFQLPMSRLGSLATLNLARPPLTVLEVLAKRTVDLVGATIGLLLALPVFIAVAVLIKLDSPGPVLFRQGRLGSNQKEFQIYKFRTMTTSEDGAEVSQAVSGDQRFTKIGQYLRRWNLDELPQLVNVLRGNMSLVGPRPHATTHDRDFETLVASYARRHNIKPGITGWAQVNGYRGPTDSIEKIEGRVDHDIYYIDNWSMLFDFYILLLTIVSPRAYRNAL